MSSRNKFLLSFGILLAVSLIPVGLVRFPPLVDYPNHLARMHILAGGGSDILGEFYRIQWAVLPNLAMDVIVPPLSKIVPLEIAGRFFIALVFFLLLSGTCALFYTLHRRISLWPLLAVLVLYNRIFLWGFLNYLFGIGLMLWALAAWIFFSDRPAYLKAFAFIIPALCLFFSHLFALGVYGLCVAGYEFSRCWRSGFRELLVAEAVAIIQFIPPGILFLFFSPTASAAKSGVVVYGDIFRKIGAMLHPVLNYNIPLDIGTALVLGALFFAGIFLKKVRVSELMYGPLVLLFIFFWIMPMAMFTAHGVDMRIPTALSFILTAASIPEPADRIRNWRTGIILVLILFGVRTTVLACQWIKADRLYSQYTMAFEKIEPGRRLFTAIAYPGNWQPFPVPLTHIPCLAIIQRSVFVPSLFTYPTQQPVRLTSNFEKKFRWDMDDNYAGGRMPDFEKISKNYDYFLMVDEVNFREKLDISWPEIYRGDNFRLLKIPVHTE